MMRISMLIIKKLATITYLRCRRRKIHHYWCLHFSEDIKEDTLLALLNVGADDCDYTTNTIVIVLSVVTVTVVVIVVLAVAPVLTVITVFPVLIVVTVVIVTVLVTVLVLLFVLGIQTTFAPSMGTMHMNGAGSIGLWSFTV